MICIYHSRDLDGWTSAAIVKKVYPDVLLIGWDYGDPIPLPVYSKGTKAIMVDISFSMDIMQEFAENASELIWIDHHKSAIKDFNEATGDWKKNVSTILNDKVAACELTWQHLVGKAMPETVRLLGMYDSFRHKGTATELEVYYFQLAARSLCSNPAEAEKFLDMGFNQHITDLLLVGQSIYAYLRTEALQIYKKHFKIDFDGYKFAAVNRERFNPVNFGIDYHKDGYDGFACFWFDGEKWTFSLYNDNKEVDVSEICSRRGGGGHKGASGFTIKDLNEILLSKEYAQ